MSKFLVNCTICSEIFDDPRMLACQHSFCRQCLDKLVEDKWLRCPQCKTLTRLPFGVEGLEVNRVILQLMGRQKRSSDATKGEVAPCSECSFVTNLSLCEHCNIDLCPICKATHFKNLKDDICVYVKKINADNRLLEVQENESIKRHEANIQKCKMVREMIESKYGYLTKKVEQEEKKLLAKVGTFETNETYSFQRKAAKLKEFQDINTFCSTVNSALNKKKEIDKQVIDMKRSCEIHMTNLKKYFSDPTFFSMPMSLYFEEVSTPLPTTFIGQVEVITQLEAMSLNDFNTARKANDDASSSSSSLSSPTRTIAKEKLGNRRFSAFEVQSYSNDSHKSSEYRNQSLKQSTATNFKFSKQNSFGFVDFGLRFGSSTRFFEKLDEKKLEVIGREGIDINEFRHPNGVTVSPENGYIYVADSWNNRLQVFDDTGAFIKVIDKLHQHRLYQPYAIHFDKKGRLYICDQSEVKIKLFDENLEFINEIGKFGENEAQIGGLVDLTTDDDNNLLVCDTYNNKIIKFNDQGEFLFEWGTFGINEGEFKNPSSIVIHQNHIIVSDWGNNRIQVFNSDGEFHCSFGKHGTLIDEFKHPSGLAIGDDDSLLIIDEGNNRIQVYDRDYAYYSSISGLKCGLFRAGKLVYHINKDKIIISDYYGHKIVIL